MNDGWARFVVFLLADPHLLEGREGRQDGTSDPYGVFPFWGCDNLNFHGRWSQGSDLLLHAVGDAGVHGGATGKDGVGVQILTDVDVTLHDRVVGGLVDTGGFHTQEGWLEQGLWASESLVTNGDDLNCAFYCLFDKPKLITCPSGSSYDFSNDEDEAAVDISCSKSRAT